MYCLKIHGSWPVAIYVKFWPNLTFSTLGLPFLRLASVHALQPLTTSLEFLLDLRRMSSNDFKGSKGTGAPRANRPHTGTPIKHDQDTLLDIVARDELQSMLDEYSADVKTAVNEELDEKSLTIETNISAKTASLLQKYDAAQCRKHGALETEISDIRKGHERLEAQNEKMQKAIDDLRKAVASAEQQTPVSPDDLAADDWTKDPDLTKLRVGATEPLARGDVLKVVQEWITDTDIQNDQWTLAGPVLGSQFFVHFKGAPGLAARRARKANLSLKQLDGNWKKLFCPNPAGTSIGLFISMDRSLQQKAQEAMGKRTKKALEEAYSDKTFFFQRRSSTITCNFKPLARMDAKSRSQQQIYRHTETLAAESISKETISQNLADASDAAAASSSAQWSL